METVVQLEDPLGLIKLSDVIFWGDWTNRRLIRSTITTGGGDVAIIYNGTSGISDLTLVQPLPSSDLNNFPNAIVSNPCEGQGCSHICVLVANSFRCLCPQGAGRGRKDLRVGHKCHMDWLFG